MNRRKFKSLLNCGYTFTLADATKFIFKCCALVISGLVFIE